jgi:thymidylate synthase
MPFKAPIVEMLWFISGSQRIDLLHEYGIHIWDTWADENGVVGPLYGYQWRHWHIDPALRHLYGGEHEIDQLARTIQTLRDRPEARSHMITAWRPDHLKAMSIKPCHVLLQFYRFEDKVSLSLYQRSCDSFIGVPFNIAQYAFLLHLVAHHISCEADTLVWHGGDVHIYENHVEQVEEQLNRTPYSFPTLEINAKHKTIDDYKFEDFSLYNYQSWGKLTADISAQGQPGQGVEL